MNVKLSKNVPIFVDLDGTLIFTDTLLEQILLYLKKNPLNFINILKWIFIGISHLKNEIRKVIEIQVENLPYNKELILWIRSQKNQGNKIYLCTATNVNVANKINNYLNLFDDVFGSNEFINLKGKKKLINIYEVTNNSEFCYVGDSKPDIEVWKKAKYAVLVNVKKKLTTKVSGCSTIIHTFNNKKINFYIISKMLRLHQWLKNFLLFVPFLTSHLSISLNAISQLILSFFAFSFCASSVYIINDLLDIDSDRKHGSKRERPFAAGSVSILVGILFFVACLIISIGLTVFIENDFYNYIILYFVITCLYTLKLKTLILVDCIILSILYTLRIISGSIPIDVDISFWLLAFSIFIFLSLAFLKRYVELSKLGSKNITVSGRGYVKSDASIVKILGIVSGFSSILVLCLYINGETSKFYYSSPEFIWLSVAIMIYWTCWVWIKAERKEIDDDPIIFASKDIVSIFVGIAFLMLFLLAKIIP